MLAGFEQGHHLRAVFAHIQERVQFPVSLEELNGLGQSPAAFLYAHQEIEGVAGSGLAGMAEQEVELGDGFIVFPGLEKP